MKKFLQTLTLVAAMALTWTLQAQTLPFTCDFENDSDTAEWVFVNGSQTNHWVIGDATNNGGQKSLYITNGSGATYNTGSISCTYAYHDFTVSNDAIYGFSFDWKCYGESSYDAMKVFVVPATTTFTAGSYPPGTTSAYSFVTAGSITGWTSLGGKLNGSSSWQTVSVEAGLEAGDYRMVIVWANDGSGGSAPSGCIDNVSISEVLCPLPNGLMASAITSDQIDLTWFQGNTPGFVVEWDTVSFVGGNGVNVQNVYTNSISLTNLEANTIYYVALASACGSETSSYIYGQFRTACVPVPIDSLPYTENFDSYGNTSGSSIDPCWYKNVMGTTTQYPYPSTTNAISGNSLYWYAYHPSSASTAPTYEWASMPLFEEDLTNLMVSFDIRRYGSVYDYYTSEVYVGVMSDPTDISTFDTIRYINLRGEAASSIHHFEIPLSNYDGTGGYITFFSGVPGTFGTSNYCYNYFYLDNVMVDYIPTCPQVDFLQLVSASNADSVTVSWTEMGDATTWDVYVCTDGVAPTDESAFETVYDTVYIGAFSPDSTYSMYVRANCGGDVSYWRGPLNFTPAAYTMTAGAVDTLRSCAVTIFDNGGPEGAYAAYSNDRLVVFPTDPSTQTLQINGSSYTESTYDYLRIYDGVGEVGTPVFNDYGVDALQTFGPIISDNGAFTIVFSSDGSVQRDGFQLSVRCVDLPNCSRPQRVIANTTSTTAEINIVMDEEATAGAWNIEYGPAGFTEGQGTSIVAYSTTETINGLTPNTSYDVYVKAICGGDSSVSRMANFHTLLSCPSISTFRVNDIRPASAHFQWTYQVNVAEFVPDTYTLTLTNDDNAAAQPQVFMVHGLDTAIGGLLPQTNYTATIVPACDTFITNGAMVSFLTNPVGCSYTDFSGNGTSQVSGAFVYSGWGNSFAEQIYTAAELRAMGLQAGPINGAAFEYTASNSYAKEFSMYIGHTTLDEFAGTSASNWVPLSDLTQVVAPQAHAIGTSGVVEYTFDTNFVWDGVSNICVAAFMNQPAGASHTATGFYSLSTAGTAYRTLYKYQDSNPLTASVTSNSASSRTQNRANIYFFSCDPNVTCVAPATYLANATPSSLDIYWIPGLNETAWKVEYKKATEDVFATAIASTTNTNYTISNLDANTVYDVRVSSICTDTTIADNKQFRTACGPMALPVVMDFEGMSTGVFDQPCYTAGALDPSVTTYAVPYVIRLTGAENQYALFWQGGYFIMPEVAAPLSSCQLRFAMVAGDTNAYMYVGYTTDGTVNGFVALDTVYRSSADSLTSCSYFTIPLSDVTESGARVMFFSNQAVNYTFIDDVVIELIPSCASAANVAASNVTDVAADLTWDAAGSLATSYIIEYGLRGFVPGTGTIATTTTNSYTLTGLVPGTVYQALVYTVCAASGDTSSAAPACLFQTGCGEITTFPYVMNFDNVVSAGSGDNYGVLPNCWNLAEFNTVGSSTNQPRVYNSTSYATSGQYVLYMYYTGHVALPAMGIPVDSLQISLKVTQTSASYQLEIGVCDTNVLDSTYVPLDTINCVSTSAAEAFTIYLAGYQGTGKYIMLHNINTYNYDYSYNYIDDIVVDRIPSCLPTQNFAATGNTATSITLGWRDLRPADEWEIAMDTVPFTPVSGTVVTSNPYTFTGLTSGQDYYFYIRTICQAGDTSAWVGPAHAVPGTWTMRQGQTDTLRMCGGTILDNGGDGDYSASSDDYVVLYPESAGHAIQLTGSYNTESCCDHLYIYEGVGTNGTLLGQYEGTGNIDVVSEAADGAITIYFHCDGSVQYSGFALNVNCVSNTCPAVGGITASAASTTSVDVDWTERGTAAQWEVEYGANGFQLGTGTRAIVAAHPYTIAGLAAMTQYDVYVRPICSDGDTGSWKMGTVATAFCDDAAFVGFGDPAASVGSSYYVPVNNYYNNSTTEIILDSASLGGVATSFAAVNFYYNYSTPTTSKNDVDIYIQPTTKSTFDDEYDYDLLDLSQAVHVYSGSLNAETGWNTFLFDTAYDYSGVGNLMMIIYDHSGAYNGSSYTWGTRAANGNVTLSWYDDDDAIDPTDFYSDWEINAVYSYYPEMQLVACGSGCAAPSLQPVANVTFEGATISWSGSADSYEVAVVETSNAIWPAEVAVVGTSYTFTGLMPSTSYSYRVRSVCDTTGTSSWREGTFTTDSLPCFAPTNVVTSNATVNSITVAWTNDAQSIAQAWVVNVFNATTNIMDTVRTNPATINGLYDNTQYSVAVQAMCAANFGSDWSDTVTFTTTSCQAVSNVNVTDITTSGAKVTWTAGANETAWEVSYGEMDFAEGQGVTVAATTTTYVITGLQADSRYDVYVRAKCADGITSDWSPVQQFQTLGNSQGIDGVEGNYSLSIYPNPTAGNTTISLRGVEGEVVITVVDMNGREITRDVMNCGSDCVKTMNVEGLAQGTYFVRVLGEGISSVRKLIVR
ncbi:MAG: fibronectin type III domain-containing protein [Bacteroidales bacterium]|nr:fibronectin type III domain-containing protein [Bacteroidales bacterium]